MHSMETPIRYMGDAGSSVVSAPIKRELDILVWMSAAFCFVLAIAVAVLGMFGPNPRGIVIALRLTARLSFLLFFTAYVGGAAFAIFGPKFSFLARHQRQFGLSFASAHLVHIGLVLWLYAISHQRPIPDSSAIMFSIGTLCIYVLALYSLDGVRKMMDPALWRIVRVIGLEYIAYLFFTDFTFPLFNGFHQPIAYLPFAILIVAGVSLRVAGWTLAREWKSMALGFCIWGPALVQLLS
jgi:hypothetical protein